MCVCECGCRMCGVCVCERESVCVSVGVECAVCVCVCCASMGRKRRERGVRASAAVGLYDKLCGCFSKRREIMHDKDGRPTPTPTPGTEGRDTGTQTLIAAIVARNTISESGTSWVFVWLLAERKKEIFVDVKSSQIPLTRQENGRGYWTLPFLTHRRREAQKISRAGKEMYKR